MKRLSIVLFAALSMFAGCKGKDSEAAKPTALELKKLGLHIEVGGETNVGDAIMGDGVMIQGESIGALQIEAMKAPKTLDDEKSDADMFSPKNLKAESLADGWVVTFDNTGSMGANYFVTVRRDIAGKSYKCSTTGSDPGQAKAVIAACKSLRS